MAPAMVHYRVRCEIMTLLQGDECTAGMIIIRQRHADDSAFHDLAKELDDAFHLC